MKKYNLLFDAIALINWNNKNSNRSGIYFVAFNVLKELLNNKNIKVTLYSENYNYKKIKSFVNKYYKNNKIDILTNSGNFLFFSLLYQLLKKRREQSKKHNRILDKIYIQIQMLILSPIQKVIEFLFVNIFFHYKLQLFNIYLSPYRAIPQKIKRIATIKNFTILHDVIPLVLPDKHFDSVKDSPFQKLIENINSNDYYFANSEYTRQDFLKYCPQIDPNKIYTTLLACDERFKPENIETIALAKKKYNIPDKKYIFSLCTLEPRKNLIRAVKTFIEFIKKNNIDDLYFVLGGGHWEMFIDKLKQEISDLGEYQDKIIRAGYIDDEDLAPLYSGAEWFVYTSMYEGFGLPPLEAMSCGCPVITSNNSSLPEVVGDAGIMVDWDSDEQHIEAYEKYYFNKELREQNRQKGLERAKQFSWKKCVNQMVEIMKKDSNKVEINS